MTKPDNYREFPRFLPAVKQTPLSYLRMTYDQEADVLYINLRKPSVVTDSELADKDVIIRYARNYVIVVTILHASVR